jgi:anti-sigma regulatory factor (Ser/Thr protein kinase)
MEHRLPHTPSAPRMARELAREAARDRLDPDRLHEFVVMVSETVSNAVRHGGPEPDGRIGLRLEAEDGVMRVAVTDGGPAFNLEREALAVRGSHHGLLMVDQFANRWGLSLDGKKAVWFEIDTGPQTV